MTILHKAPATCDVESYPNYYLISAKTIGTDDQPTCWELRGADDRFDADTIVAIKRYFAQHRIVTFNGNGYDMPLISAALDGQTTKALNQLSDDLINDVVSPFDSISEQNRSMRWGWEHVDLQSIVAGTGSLKSYGARLGSPRLQDLPIEPGTELTFDQMDLIREYCGNDLAVTERLHDALIGDIKLREVTGEQWGLNLLSSSDTGIAIKYVAKELGIGRDHDNGGIPAEPFKYQIPAWLDVQHDRLREVLAELADHEFTIDQYSGKVDQWGARVGIGSADYSMGIGGLHSSEKYQHYEAGDDHLLIDVDVTSYYPSLILAQGLVPRGLGPKFLDVFNRIVEKRVAAKHAGDKITAGSLKIVINSLFGNLGNKGSIFYDPEMLIQVTLTGQLALLMLVDRLHAAGITAISANTDGVTSYLPKDREAEFTAICDQWQADTGMNLERVDYSKIAYVACNAYVALKSDGGIKAINQFKPYGLTKSQNFDITWMAVTEYLLHGRPVNDTIRGCTDINAFMKLRKVKGGAVWNGQRLGKNVRFYRSNADDANDIIDAKSGNRAADTESCRPLMDLPDEFPADVDLNWYIAKANAEIECFSGKAPADVTNKEFIEGVFGEIEWGNARISGFPEDPAETKGFPPKKASGSEAALSKKPGHNQYYNCSLFNDAEQIGDGGKVSKSYSVTEQHWRSLVVVVIDDVGDGASAKVPESVLRDMPPPSFRLETSPGNFQVGFILENPITDPGTAKSLLAGIVDRVSGDGADPGIGGISSWFRLPGGSNTKAKYKDADGNPFKCRLVSADFNRRYSVEALTTPWSIDVTPGASSFKVVEFTAPGDSAFDQHPLIAAIRSDAGRRLLHPRNGVNSSGFMDINCPWNLINETHTGGLKDRRGAGIKVVDANGEVIIKCQHGSCQTINNHQMKLALIEKLSSIDAGIGQRYDDHVAAVSGEAVKGLDDVISRLSVGGGNVLPFTETRQNAVQSSPQEDVPAAGADRDARPLWQRYENFDLDDDTEMAFVLDDVIDGDGPVVLAGESGIGKTSMVLALFPFVTHLCKPDAEMRPLFRRKVVVVTEHAEQVIRVLKAMKLFGSFEGASQGEISEWIKVVRAERVNAVTIARMGQQGVFSGLSTETTIDGDTAHCAPWVVLDTTSANFELESENDSSGVSQCIAALKSNHPGVPFLLIAHTAKTQRKAGKGDADNVTPRGSGAFIGDGYQLLVAVDDADIGGRRIQLTQKKRFNTDWMGIQFHPEVVTWDGPKKFGRIPTRREIVCVPSLFDREKDEQDTSERKDRRIDDSMDDIRERALNILAAEMDAKYLSATVLIELLGGREADVTEALRRLADAGELPVISKSEYKDYGVHHASKLAFKTGPISSAEGGGI